MKTKITVLYYINYILCYIDNRIRDYIVSKAILLYCRLGNYRYDHMCFVARASALYHASFYFTQ